MSLQVTVQAWCGETARAHPTKDIRTVAKGTADKQLLLEKHAEIFNEEQVSTRSFKVNMQISKDATPEFCKARAF